MCHSAWLRGLKFARKLGNQTNMNLSLIRRHYNIREVELHVKRIELRPNNLSNLHSPI